MEEDLKRIAELSIKRVYLRKEIKSFNKDVALVNKIYVCTNSTNNIKTFLGRDRCRKNPCSNCQKYFDVKREMKDKVELLRRTSIKLTAACRKVIKQREKDS